MIVVFYGLPGSGKGTQAKLLSKKYNMLHISSGSLIREHVRKKREGYETIEKIINAGKLIPDEKMVDLLMQHINANDNYNGYILDGFPRTIKQHKLSKKILPEEKYGKLVDIYIYANEKEVKRRVLGRRICKECHSIFNIYKDDIRDICLKCNGKLVKRKDDNENVFMNRIRIFHESTKPLIDFLKKEGNIFVVDGNRQDIDGINKDIFDIINKVK